MVLLIISNLIFLLVGFFLRSFKIGKIKKIWQNRKRHPGRAYFMQSQIPEKKELEDLKAIEDRIQKEQTYEL